MDRTFPSTDPQRKNVSGIRHKYRELEPYERELVDKIKSDGQSLFDIIDDIPTNREGTARSVALAKTKLDEAVMWAVHAVTNPEPEREHEV